MGTLILAFIGMGYKVLVPGMGYYNTWDVMTKVFFWIFVTMVPITIANFVAIQLNNRRIRKMCEYLNISLDEYKKCVDLWNIKT